MESVQRSSAPRRRKPKRALGLAPVAAVPPAASPTAPASNQQREAAAHGGRAEPSPVAPLDLVFADAERRVIRTIIDLRGFRVSDQWLARAQSFLPTGGAASAQSLALDDSARVVSARALQRFLGAVAHGSLRSLRLAACPGLDAQVVALDVVPATLVELDVCACEWVDDLFARAVARRCPALAKVALARCRRLTDYGVAAFADPPPPAAAARAGTQRRLTSLDISFCTKVTDSGVLALLTAVATAGLRLRELRADGLPLVEGLSWLGLPRFGAGGASIDALSLSALSSLRASAIASLSSVGALANVRELDLSSCAMVDDEALQALCVRPSGGRGGSASGCARLGTLKLAFCSSTSDLGISLLLGAADSSCAAAGRPSTDGGGTKRRGHALLKHVDLTGCFRLTDAGVVALAEACPELETLLIDGVRRVGAKGVHALAQHCRSLHTLHWGGILVRASGSGRGSSASTSSSGDFFSVPQISAAVIAGFELAAGLHTLRIGSTECDVDALASRLGRFGPRLVDLDVTGIATDALCHAIGASCANLRALRLSRSRYFSEPSFLRVAAGCGRLEALDLESCEQIRDAGLHAVAAACPLLERLNLANDWQVTDSGVAAVGKGCARLKALNVRHCPEVSLSVLHAVAAQVGGGNLLVASADGLARKHPSVVAFLRGDNARRAAARRITRWMQPRTTAGRRSARSALLLALAWVRYRRRCAVRIQRSVRRFLGVKRQRELLRGARRARAATLASNLRLLRAYVALSTLLRELMRRWAAHKQRQAYLRAEAARLARAAAATCIQRHARGRLARRRAAAAREERRLARERRVGAAVDIQRLYRGLRGRARALETRARLGAAMRAAMAASEGRFAVAVHVQRLARGALGRHRARRTAQARAERLALRKTSARRLQRAFRAFVARVALRNLLFRGARALQRVARGFLGRERARTVVLARAYARQPLILAPQGGHACIFTRALAVTWKRKRDAALAVAENLQRLYRGAVGRVLFRLALAAARQRAHTLDRSARALQHFFRSLLILTRLARLQSRLRLRWRSATAIQAAWRMWQAKALAFARRLRADRRRKLAARRQAMENAPRADGDGCLPPGARRRRGRPRSLLDEAVATQQRAQRRRQVRELVARARPPEPPPAPSLRLLQLGAAHALARFYRAQLALRGWQSPASLRLRHASATRVQAAVRGRLARRAARALRRALEAAARLVQRAWRGQRGRRAWRRLVEVRRGHQRELDERDRAGRVALRRTGQLALEALARDARAAAVLQRWYRTLRGRQVFRERREARRLALERAARDRLAEVLRAGVAESAVFQARVWRACVDERAALLALEDEQVAAAERELRELRRECRAAHVGAVQAALDAAALAKRRADAQSTRAARVRAVEALKARVRPFAAQAAQLTLESARVQADNRRLQRALGDLGASVESFRAQLRAALPMEPLLLPADVERLLALLPDSSDDP